MPYVLTRRTTFTMQVTVSEPGNSADGSIDEFRFVAEFKRYDGDQIEALLKENKPVRAALQDLLVGWSGLHDENGRELPFNDSYRDALLKIPPAVVGLWTAFLQGSSGAARKN